MIINNCHSMTKQCLKLVLWHVPYSRVCLSQEPKRHLGTQTHVLFRDQKFLIEHGMSIQKFLNRFHFKIIRYLLNLMVSGKCVKEQTEPNGWKLRECWKEHRDKVSNGYETEHGKISIEEENMGSARGPRCLREIIKPVNMNILLSWFGRGTV